MNRQIYILVHLRWLALSITIFSSNLLISCKQYTDNPDLPADGNRYFYDPDAARKSQRKLEKTLLQEQKRFGQLNVAAEKLKQQIAALKLDRNRQAYILNSKSSTTQEKQRAREKIQALEGQINDRIDQRNLMLGVVS